GLGCGHPLEVGDRDAVLPKRSTVLVAPQAGLEPARELLLAQRIQHFAGAQLIRRFAYAGAVHEHDRVNHRISSCGPRSSRKAAGPGTISVRSAGALGKGWTAPKWSSWSPARANESWRHLARGLARTRKTERLLFDLLRFDYRSHVLFTYG